MKTLAALITGLNQEQIAKIEQTGELEIQVDGVPFILVTEDVEILSADIPGYKVANEGKITVALDITLTSELKQEGIAREVVNRLQNLRKEMGLDVTDRIAVEIKNNEKLNDAINLYKTYICSQILAEVFTLVNQLDGGVSIEVEDVVTDVKLNFNQWFCRSLYFYLFYCGGFRNLFNNWFRRRLSSRLFLPQALPLF